MTSRVVSIVAVCTLVLAAAFAQSTSTSSDPMTPATVESPQPALQTTSSGRPLSPEQPGESDAGVELAAAPSERFSSSAARADAAAEPDAVVEDEVAAEGGVTIPEDMDRREWRISPIFGAGVVYDDNIFFSNTNRVSDVIWTVSAGLALQLGDFRRKSENYLQAQWVGIGVFYTNNPEEDSFNQIASLSGQLRWGKLTTQLESGFSYITGPNREVAAQTTTISIRNALRFLYAYSDKTTFDLEFVQNTELTENYDNQYDYRGKLGFNYLIFPKVTIGLEAVGGALVQDDSPLQLYQQVRVRGTYTATDKLVFKASAGAEFREFDDSGVPLKIEPVFSLGLEYTPFEGTSITLVGFRDLVGSVDLLGQDYIATGLEIAVRQRFFQKFLVGVTFGYENDQYFGVTSETETDRVDNYIYVRPNLTYTFTRWLSTTVFYEFRNNQSTESDRTFYNNRVGMELAARF